MTFQELATKAQTFYCTESKKDKVEFDNNVNFPKSTTNEAMSTSTSQPIHIIRKQKVGGKKCASFKVATNKCLILKVLQEKKYQFPNSDLLGMLDDLL